jgi:hypothetical protein
MLLAMRLASSIVSTWAMSASALGARILEQFLEAIIISKALDYNTSRANSVRANKGGLAQCGQLGDVAGNAPSLIHGQHIGYVSIGFGLAPIHVSERLAVSILHFVAAWNLLNRPWWREVARYCVTITKGDRQSSLRLDHNNRSTALTILVWLVGYALRGGS